MLPEVAADRLGQVPCQRGQRVVDAGQVERDALTEMTEDHGDRDGTTYRKELSERANIVGTAP